MSTTSGAVALCGLSHFGSTFVQEETASHSLAEIERSSVTFQKYLFVGFLLISLFSKDERSRDVSGLMELDGKVHVGNLHRVGCRGCRLVPPSGKLPWTRPGCREARFGSGLHFVTLCSTLFTEQVCFGHRYLQILFFRARLVKRETLSEKCSYFTIFLRARRD